MDIFWKWLALVCYQAAEQTQNMSCTVFLSAEEILWLVFCVLSVPGTKTRSLKSLKITIMFQNTLEKLLLPTPPRSTSSPKQTIITQVRCFYLPSKILFLSLFVLCYSYASIPSWGNTKLYIEDCKLRARFTNSSYQTLFWHFKLFLKTRSERLALKRCGHRYFCGWSYCICICRSFHFRC